MRNEVISDKKTHQNPIIDDILQIIVIQTFQRLKFIVKIFSEQGKMQEVEGGLLRGWYPLVGPLALFASKLDLFSEQREVGVMGAEAKHDEVSIQTI